MLAYCKLDHWEQISAKFVSNYNNFLTRQCIWTHRLQNGGHFVSVSTCPSSPFMSLKSRRCSTYFRFRYVNNILRYIHVAVYRPIRRDPTILLQYLVNHVIWYLFWSKCTLTELLAGRICLHTFPLEKLENEHSCPWLASVKWQEVVIQVS